MTHKHFYEKPESESVFLSQERSFCGPSNPDSNTTVSDLYDSDEVMEEEW